MVSSSSPVMVRATISERKARSQWWGRLTRLANASSKKIENLEHDVALHFMHYNFARPHKTLTPKGSIGVTPAMAAGVSNHIWTIEEIVKLAD